ncbi:MAG: type VI secretion system contractile sheath domain-containing protein [Terriglobia bacterium]
MAKALDFGKISFDVQPGSDPATEIQSRPFRILILGDFSGQGENQGPLAGRRPCLVDRDNFDDVLKKLRPALTVPLGEARVDIHFEGIDDFHPDRLFERVVLFQKLRELRERMSNASTFPEAAAELGLAPRRDAPGNAAETEPPRAADAAQMVARNLLEDAISATEGQSAGLVRPQRPGDLASFIQRAVAPHLTARPDPRQAEWVGIIDQTAAAQMRALLHLPAFKALEAAWRAVFFLVRRIETDAALKIYLLDVGKGELTRDLGLAENADKMRLETLVVDEAAGMPGGEPWALIAGNYTFHRTLEDLTLLRSLERIAHEASAPFVADAGPDLVGCASPADLAEPRKWNAADDSNEDRAWQALRRSPEASYLGLVIPRFLLRLPYGNETDPAERFEFEEIMGAPDHDDYLWGNSVCLCITALADEFAAHGWEMQPGHSHDTGGLPLHVYRRDGEAVAAPCAEVSLTNDAAERILDAGLMPVVPLRGQDVVRLVRLQSIADPLRGLSGRWR